MHPDAPKGNQSRSTTMSPRQNPQTCSGKLVTLTFASWNRVGEWLRHVDGLRLS